ncbi:MAG: hypothetical protein ABSF71_01520 [Terriglobia bacterium]|jgi:hypothetical protein
MIKVKQENGELTVLIGGNEAEITAAGEDYILAECSLSDLAKERSQALPKGLELEIHSEDGFGTYFFYDVRLSEAPSGVAMAFRCHTPNKYWEGQFGLATFIAAIRDQAVYHHNWKVTEIETEDDWKGITLERAVALGDPLEASIRTAASDLNVLLHSAEVALSGLPWREEYTTNEDAFCRELIHPLLRRMGFVFVRYTHGKREYGKDFTFSELTPFGHYRHYGLQAKAGNVSGGVNAAIDELLGQIADAFTMPYYELGSKEPRYISTFIIAISGRFTENGREKIVEKMPKGVIGSVYFVDRESITELVERHWKAK